MKLPITALTAACVLPLSLVAFATPAADTRPAMPAHSNAPTAHEIGRPADLPH